MKRRKNRGAEGDAGRRPTEGRTGRTLPNEAGRPQSSPSVLRDPSTLRRPSLAPEGSRWLRFSGRLAQRHAHPPCANTLAFIESLYGGKFKTAEGAPFSQERIYRKVAGGVFVSETRLRLSLRPRFDLRVLNVIPFQEVSQILRGVSTTINLPVLNPARARENEQPPRVWHAANSYSSSFQATSNAFYQTTATGSVQLLRRPTHAGPPSMSLLHATRDGGDSRRSATAQTWNAVHERHSARYVMAARANVETPRPSQAEPRAGRRSATNDHPQHVPHASAQEFVRVLRQTSAPLRESREILSVRTTRDHSVVMPKDSPVAGERPQETSAAGETHMRFTPAERGAVRQLPGRTFVVLTPRQAHGGTVEKGWELKPAETGQVQVPATHAPRREQWPGIFRVQPHTPLQIALTSTSPTFLAAGPASTPLRIGLTKTSLTLLTPGSVSAHHTSYSLSGREPVLLLQQTPTGRTRPDVTEGPRAVNTPVGRVHTTLAEQRTQAVVVTQIGSTPLFLSHGARVESDTRRNLKHVRARAPFTSTLPASVQATSPGFQQVPGETLRPVPAGELPRAASPPGQTVRIPRESTPRGLTTHALKGAGTFLFPSGLRGGMRGTTWAGTSESPRAGSARAAAADGAARGAVEATASRPEGMALELVRQRREEVLRLPPLGYVFTQTSRPQLEERQVITRAGREEIVEVVRREVRELAAASPAAGAVARADFAGLADEVYATLVRRLMVEKERLGLS